jgi:hypothetical protein
MRANTAFFFSFWECISRFSLVFFFFWATLDAGQKIKNNQEIRQTQNALGISVTNKVLFDTALRNDMENILQYVFHHKYSMKLSKKKQKTKTRASISTCLDVSD